jgi:hypothetical protein
MPRACFSSASSLSACEIRSATPNRLNHIAAGDVGGIMGGVFEVKKEIPAYAVAWRVL